MKITTSRIYKRYYFKKETEEKKKKKKDRRCKVNPFKFHSKLFLEAKFIDICLVSPWQVLLGNTEIHRSEKMTKPQSIISADTKKKPYRSIRNNNTERIYHTMINPSNTIASATSSHAHFFIMWLVV